MKGFSKTWCFVLWIPALAVLWLNGCSEPKKPNVVFILTDQWRASALGYMGDPNVKTPELDDLASRSVSFVNAVSVCPVCTPYRAALLTGRFPTSTGMTFNDIYLPSEELCMAEIFQSAGYKTAYLGKWHLDGHGRLNNVDPDRRQGFEYWKGAECSHDYNHMLYYENDDPEMKFWEGYSPNALSRDARDYMDRYSGDRDPFLLFISVATPHFPHNSAPEEYKKLYPLSEIRLSPNVPEELYDKVLPEIQGYYAHCTATDRAIGELVDYLTEKGLMEHTILVFTSDHGEMMGSHGRLPFRKQLAWNESVHVPFLISYPGIGQNRGARVNAPLTTPDILPSLLGLCGIPVPETIEGKDLSTLIRSADPAADRAALIMNVTPFDVNWDDAPYKGIRTSRYTYAVSPEGPAMLFDDRSDPFQMNNLAGDSGFEGIKDTLQRQLNTELQKIGEAEMHPREYYINKWGYEIERNNINFWSFSEGKGKVQGPGIRSANK
jgi:arylsulfatase A-like enzyme